MIRVVALDHFVLRVRDLDAALAFYRDILGLTIEMLDEYRTGTRPFVSARVGAQLIDLVPDPTYDSQDGLRAGGLMHFCVEVEPPVLAIIAWLRSRGIEVIEDQPVLRLGARGMGLSIYVRDPDGYVVELKERAA